MATAQLTAKRRTEAGKGVARKLRNAQMIPGIIYGHNREPEMLAIDARELERLLERVAAETTVVELNIEGSTARTLIREIQRHPFKRHLLHIDFQELVAGEKVTVNVPLVLLGTPAGVRNAGGVLDQIMRELSVRVDPTNIPNRLDVDVTALGLNDSIHVRDIQVPAGVEVLDDGDATVCVVVPPRVEVEAALPTEAPAEGVTEPELIRKPKAEEGEGEEK
jgi:large subunit ribosomal protein L25